MSKKYRASKTRLELGDTLVPAVREVNRETGNMVGPLIPDSAHRQDPDGHKCHGGHCAFCNDEMQRMTPESFRGICDECNAEIEAREDE